MAKKTNRIPKSDDRQLQDFEDYYMNLMDAISLFENGQVRSYKTILHSLRVLVADKSAGRQQFLLDRMIDRYQIDISIQFKGLEGIPEQNPLSKDRKVPIREYLDGSQVTLMGQPLSCRKFIWRLGSQDSLHADESIDEDLALGEDVSIAGVQANQRAVLAIARNVSSACETLLEAISRKIST